MEVTGSLTVAATANVLCDLRRRDAASALDTVLAHVPDVVGLQEWGPSRRRLLPPGEHHWVAPAYGGCVVGVRRDRYDLLSRSRPVLAPVGRSDRGARPVPVLPPRVATLVRLLDRRRGRTLSVLVYHLVPGTQRRGDYRDDRPLLAARHRREVASLRAVVTDELVRGHEVLAMGDSNWHGLTLPGLVSAWEGRETEPGTLGSYRKIDDVLGMGPALSVVPVRTASDHVALVVTRADA